MKVMLTVLSLIVAFGLPWAQAAPRPNIVLIFADDLGWKDVGYQGSDFAETPHLDRLAQQGIVFTAGYAAAGNCAPSRACLLSGTYTPRHHVYAVGSTDRGTKALHRLIPIPNRSGLAKENVTIADALQAAGYATGHFGKWHLAGKDGSRPTEQGFDVSFDSFGEGKLREGSNANPFSGTSPATSTARSSADASWMSAPVSARGLSASSTKPSCQLAKHLGKQRHKLAERARECRFRNQFSY